MDMPDSDGLGVPHWVIYLIKATSWGSGAWNRSGNEKELTIQRMIEIRSTKTIYFISRLQEFNACPIGKQNQHVYMGVSGTCGRSYLDQLSVCLSLY